MLQPEPESTAPGGSLNVSANHELTSFRSLSESSIANELYSVSCATVHGSTRWLRQGTAKDLADFCGQRLSCERR